MDFDKTIEKMQLTVLKNIFLKLMINNVQGKTIEDLSKG